MNRLNPLYILALLFVIAFISLNLSEVKKIDYLKSNHDLKVFEQKVVEYNQLKSRLSTKKESLQLLKNIMNDTAFKEGQLSNQIEKNRAVVKLVTDQRKLMQRFLNRFLNKNIKIMRMEATKKYIIVEVKL